MRLLLRALIPAGTASTRVSARNCSVMGSFRADGRKAHLPVCLHHLPQPRELHQQPQSVRACSNRRIVCLASVRFLALLYTDPVICEIDAQCNPVRLDELIGDSLVKRTHSSDFPGDSNRHSCMRCQIGCRSSSLPSWRKKRG
jgi:hypothetical protein